MIQISGSGSVHQETKKLRKPTISSVLWLLNDFLSSKTDVNAPTKSKKQKSFFFFKNYLFFVGILKATGEKNMIQIHIRIRNRWYRSMETDPDPYQNVTDPEHYWMQGFLEIINKAKNKRYVTLLVNLCLTSWTSPKAPLPMTLIRLKSSVFIRFSPISSETSTSETRSFYFNTSDLKLLFQHLWLEAFKTVIGSDKKLLSSSSVSPQSPPKLPHLRQEAFISTSLTRKLSSRQQLWKVSISKSAILSFSLTSANALPQYQASFLIGWKNYPFQVFNIYEKKRDFQHLGQQSFSFNLTFATKLGLHQREEINVNILDSSVTIIRNETISHNFLNFWLSVKIRHFKFQPPYPDL